MVKKKRPGIPVPLYERTIKVANDLSDEEIHHLPNALKAILDEVEPDTVETFLEGDTRPDFVKEWEERQGITVDPKPVTADLLDEMDNGGLGQRSIPFRRTAGMLGWRQNDQ